MANFLKDFLKRQTASPQERAMKFKESADKMLDKQGMFFKASLELVPRDELMLSGDILMRKKRCNERLAKLKEKFGVEVQPHISIVPLVENDKKEE